MSFGLDAFQVAWLDAELAHLGISHVACTKIDEILDTLKTDTPDMVFADVSHQALGCFALRERGWFGPLYSIGEASRNLCYALGITGTLSAPLSREAFRDALQSYVNDRLPTVRQERRSAQRSVVHPPHGRA